MSEWFRYRSAKATTRVRISSDTLINYKIMEILEYPTIKCKCECKFSFTKEDFKEDKIYQGTTPHLFSIYKIETYINCPFCDKRYLIKSRSKVE